MTPDDAAECSPRLPPWAAPGLLLAVGLLTQARARAGVLWEGDTDAAKYVALARSLPDYVLYDGHPYLIHPAGYPSAIRLVAGLSGSSLTAAASFLGGLCVIGLALLTYALGRRLLELPPAAALAAGGLVLFSRAAETLGQGIWREPFQTVAVYGLLSLALLPPPTSRGRKRALLVVAAALGCLLGATWDPFVFTVPLLLGGAWLLRRPPLLAAGLALLLSWGSWTSWRHEVLTAGSTYPAGIDGTVEDTTDPPLKTWLNPNFLPRTARHNAYFWPVTPTPLRPFRAAAPWFSAPPDYALALTAYAPSPLLQIAGCVLLILPLAGLVLLARAPPQAWRGLLLLALVGGLLGGPGLIGRTARYGFALLPLVALLSARCLQPLAQRHPKQTRLAVIATCAIATAGWLIGSTSWTWTRPHRFEARSAAAAIASLDTSGRAVAATINTTPDLAWELPGKRVVTLPALPGWGLETLLAEREVGAIVVPHELHTWDRPGFPPAWRDEAHSVPTLAALRQAVQDGELHHLGVTLEAELADRPRARCFDLLWRGPSPPPKFGLFLEADSLPGLAAALEADAITPETRRLLTSNRAALEQFLADPATRESAEKVLAGL